MFTCRGAPVRALCVALLVLVVHSASAAVTELEFREPTRPAAGESNEPDVGRVLDSIVRVRDGLYLVTIQGDCSELLLDENQDMIDDPLINDRSRYCSVFSTAGENGVFMGRNWDNENVGSIMGVLYRPTGGYDSIFFARSIELGFGKDIDLAAIESHAIGERLLRLPFYSMDGVNEHGLMVAVAGDQTTTVSSKEGRELVGISFVIRKLLDRTRTVDEAVALVRDYVPFLLDAKTLAGHLLVADASGASAVLEHDEDGWLVTRSEEDWQAMSTKRVHGVAEETLREDCWRYDTMCGALAEAEGRLDWAGSLALLEDCEQKGTTWSIVFSPEGPELWFSVYKEWDSVYHLAMP